MGATSNHIDGLGQPGISLVEPMPTSRICSLSSPVQFCWQGQRYRNSQKEGLRGIESDNYVKIPKKEPWGVNGHLDIFEFQAILAIIRPEKKDVQQAYKQTSICTQEWRDQILVLSAAETNFPWAWMDCMSTRLSLPSPSYCFQRREIPSPPAHMPTTWRMPVGTGLLLFPQK